VALDPQTGDLINANFISIANLPSGVKPHALLHSDGQRVLISHQIQDVVYAYDLIGNFLGIFAPAGVRTLRSWITFGVAFIQLQTALWYFLHGTNINAVVEFDLDGNFLGTFIAPGAGGIVGPWSILFRGSDVLVSASGDNISATCTTARRLADGTWRISTFLSRSPRQPHDILAAALVPFGSMNLPPPQPDCHL
jgi:hypothetical protein